MAITLRRITDDDAEQSQALSREAFGPSPEGAGPAPVVSPARHPWGAFDDGRLLARVTAREFGSWWYGQEVPTTGIASVAVTAEARGRGLLGRLFEVVLAEAGTRGEVLSTLFPTAPGIYQRLGYETVGALEDIEVPTLTLARLRPTPGVSLRRATTADLPAVRGVYARWAATQRGPLTRTGPSYPQTDDEILAAHTGITLAVDEATGDVLGYVSWERGPGYDASSWVSVDDLLAVDARAFPTLWSHLASFASVTGTVRLSSSGMDAARRHLLADPGRVTRQRPYMLRVDDVAAALSVVATTIPSDAAPVSFAVAGDALGRADGTYRLGEGRCERVEDGAVGGVPTFSPRGLALAYAGVESCAGLRFAGVLSGPDGDDAQIDRWWGRQPVRILDYF